MHNMPVASISSSNVLIYLFSQQNVVVEEEITEISAEDAQAEEDEQNQDQEATVMDHSILGIDCSWRTEVQKESHECQPTATAELCIEI